MALHYSVRFCGLKTSIQFFLILNGLLINNLIIFFCKKGFIIHRMYVYFDVLQLLNFHYNMYIFII